MRNNEIDKYEQWRSSSSFTREMYAKCFQIEVVFLSTIVDGAHINKHMHTLMAEWA